MKYTYFVDELVTVWRRSFYEIEADSLEDSETQIIENTLSRKLKDPIKTEYLPNTDYPKGDFEIYEKDSPNPLYINYET